MRRVGILSVFMIAGALAIPRAASSQAATGGGMSAAALLSPTPTELLMVGPASPGGPRMEAIPNLVPVLPQVRNRRGIPWMIAGGAMFLAGAIIGDDGGTILLLGGLGVGAYGTYIYFEG